MRIEYNFLLIEIDFLFNLAVSSKDLGVQAVWEIVDSLYSDLTNQKFKDLNLHADDLRKVEYAMLFLRTDFEYLWPPFPSDHGSWFRGVFWLCALLVLALSAILGFGNLFHQPLIGLIWLSVAGTTIFFLYLDRRRQKYKEEAQWKLFKEHGEGDLWPFLNRDDFEKAQKASCGLFNH